MLKWWKKSHRQERIHKLCWLGPVGNHPEYNENYLATIQNTLATHIAMQPLKSFWKQPGNHLETTSQHTSNHPEQSGFHLVTTEITLAMT